MGYVETSLVTGEVVRFKTKKHWTTFLTLKGLLTLFIWPAIERATSEYAVTNKRVIMKTGLIWRETFEMALQKIESIGVEQSLLGRMLGYGTVTVSGTGQNSVHFGGVCDPMGFRKAYVQAIDDAPQRPAVHE